MKTLGNLDLCGNTITNVAQVLDTEGNPIGGGASVQQGMAFKVYEGTFDSSEASSDTDTDSGGNTINIQYVTIDGDTHGVLNPIVQLFEVDEGNNKDTVVNADIVVNSDDNDITFKFAADENGDVADWANGTVYYKYRVLGLDALASGSDSGNGE